MRVTINGFPKAGCHALARAVQLVGIPCQMEEHRSHALGVAGPHIFIKRDFRNVVLSAVRFQLQALTPSTFAAQLRTFHFARNAPLVEAARQYEGWLTDSDTLVVSYEPLIESDGEMRRIADHLSVSYAEGAWENLPGGTHTWNPVHCDWRKVWGDELESAWQAEGGYELLARWGY